MPALPRQHDGHMSGEEKMMMMPVEPWHTHTHSAPTHTGFLHIAPGALRRSGAGIAGRIDTCGIQMAANELQTVIWMQQMQKS